MQHPDEGDRPERRRAGRERRRRRRRQRRRRHPELVQLRRGSDGNLSPSFFLLKTKVDLFVCFLSL